MVALEEYVLCPALSRWLPARLGQRVACVCPPGRDMPRALRKVCRTWGETAAAPWTGLVIAGVLDDRVDDIADAALEDLQPGGLVADLCVLPPRGLRGFFSPPLRAARIREASAERLTGWLARGLYDVEQWIAVDPPDVVVTLGRRRAG